MVDVTSSISQLTLDMTDKKIGFLCAGYQNAKRNDNNFQNHIVYYQSEQVIWYINSRLLQERIKNIYMMWQDNPFVRLKVIKITKIRYSHVASVVDLSTVSNFWIRRWIQHVYCASCDWILQFVIWEYTVTVIGIPMFVIRLQFLAIIYPYVYL